MPLITVSMLYMVALQEMSCNK